MFVMKYTFNNMTFTRAEDRGPVFTEQNFSCSFSFTVQLQGRVSAGHRYTFGWAWCSNYTKTNFRHSLNQSNSLLLVVLSFMSLKGATEPTLQQQTVKSDTHVLKHGSPDKRVIPMVTFIWTGKNIFDSYRSI